MSDDAELNTTSVDLGGLLTVLGANLYSSPEVAVRELVQNAHDACTRRRIEAPGAGVGEIVIGASPGRIWIEDTGAGLTRDEIKRYLATIGAGYTGVLRRSTEVSALIGAFGLGFLSAYMVAKRVEVVSTSYQSPDIGVRFVSDSGRTYVIQAAPARSIGSRIDLELRDECAHIADLFTLERVLHAHCRLLHVPIRLDWSGRVINAHPPPWRREDLAGAPPVRLRRERLDFVAQFDPNFAPLCVLPIARREPGDPGEGLVWVHDANTYGSTDNRRLSVFVRGMRVAANERDLLPAWAGFASGLYEADALTPTASREALQKDEVFERARRQIARELGSGLAALAGEEPDSWRRVLRRHNEALLGAAIADDALFMALKDELTLPTSAGDLTAAAIAARSDHCIHVAQAEEAGLDGLLARTLGAPIVDGMRYGAFAFARKWAQINTAGFVQVGSSRGLDALFPPAAVAAEEMALLESWFGANARVRAARFAPAALPLLVVEDEDAALKSFLDSDEADARLGAGALALARAFTTKVEGGPTRVVIVNLESPAIAEALRRRDPQVAQLLGALIDLIGARAAKRGGLADALTEISNALVAILGRTP